MNVAIQSTQREELSGLVQELNCLTAPDLAMLNSWLAKPQQMWIARLGDAVIGAWGLIPPTLLSESAYLWMITFPESDDYQFTIVRRSQIEIQKMLKEYPKIVGHCEVTAARSIRWLKWLGATFKETETNGLLEFTIRRGDG